MTEEGTIAYAVHMHSDFPGVARKLLFNMFWETHCFRLRPICIVRQNGTYAYRAESCVEMSILPFIPYA